MKKNIPIVDAYHKTFIIREELPLPFVHYPGITGPFIGFSKNEDSEICFCSCFIKTLEHYLLRRISDREFYSYEDLNYILSSRHFPYDFVEKLLKDKTPSTSRAVLDKIYFKDKICHQCNAISPQYRVNYCNMSSFELQHAWYVKKKLIDIGLQLPDSYLNRIPDEYLSLLKVVWKLHEQGQNAAMNHDYEKASDFYNESSKKYTVFHRLIENEVRNAFHYPLVGERWKEETKLYKIVKELFPNHEIIKNYRPDWLERLELDIFLPEIPLGIEYQGIQHYHPLKHWGGKAGLIKRQEHDARKLNLANQNNVPIVYFTYTDCITEELVSERIKKYLK